MYIKNPIWSEPGVSPRQAIRTTLIDGINTDADSVMSTLVRISGVAFAEEQKASAKLDAVDETTRGYQTLVDWIVAWNSEPALCEFANALHRAAVVHDKLSR